MTMKTAAQRRRRTALPLLTGLVLACGPTDAPDEAGAAGADTVATAVPVPAPVDSAAAPPPADDLLTADGLGPLRVGMTRAEVEAAMGPDARPDLVGGAEPQQCEEFRPERAPDGVLVMMERNRLTRISIHNGNDIRTPEGLAVGDGAAAIKAAYGARAEVTPHKYMAAPAEYITVWRDGAEPEGRRGLRYEVGLDGRVTHIRGGGESILYVEGCS